MASLHQRSGSTFHVSFRFQGQQFMRSLGTKDEKTARQKKALVEQTIQHIDDGVISIDDDVSSEELWLIIKSGGKLNKKKVIRKSETLTKVFAQYRASFSANAKEATTVATERQHTRHFERLMGGHTLFEDISPSKIRNYVSLRAQEPGTHGRTVQPVTIRKELQTLSQIWEFAKADGKVRGVNPFLAVKKPRGNQKPPFMAWEEIQTRIERGGLDQGEIAELWEALFLREAEIGELLEHVRVAARTRKRFSFAYPAIAFCAYTGARRSEMFRCRIDDCSDKIMLREKKKSRTQCITFREVPVHPELGEILSDWISAHPGGQYLFCKSNMRPLDDKTSRQAFKAVTEGSRWSVLRGYHVLRHSFASNLARHAVSQYKIDEMLGHQTEEMRRRYRHLFPEDRSSAIQVLSYA